MSDPLHRAERACPPEAMGRLKSAVFTVDLSLTNWSEHVIAAVLDEIVAMGGSWSIPAHLEPRKAVKKDLKGGVE